MKYSVFYFLSFLLIAPFHFDANADDEITSQINIRHVPHGGTHSEYYTPADMPEVYYDSDDQEIIIVADGFATYYDVDIVSQSTQLAVISTQVDGYGDTIDISSLPDDDYTIVITSEYNNVYEGYFTNYWCPKESDEMGIF